MTGAQSDRCCANLMECHNDIASFSQFFYLIFERVPLIWVFLGVAETIVC